MGKLNLGSAENVLNILQSQREQALTNAQKFIQQPELKTILKSYRAKQEATYEKAKVVLGLFKRGKFDRYNVFRKIGFVASEDFLSDAIASLLNPTDSHGLGIKPLSELFEYLKEEWKGTRYFSRIDKILKILERDEQYISVHREKSEHYTRPDITILGSEFAIIIENKKRGGKETVHKKEGLQTIRQGKALKELADRLGIPEDNTMCIYLTPEGKDAANKDCVPLRVDELISILRKSLQSSSNGVNNSISAFLDFYSFE